MKKLIALFLMLVMCVSLMAGCRTAKTPAPAPADTPAESPAEAPAVEPAEDGKVSQPGGYPNGTIDFVVPAAAGALVDLDVRAMKDAVDLGTSSISVTNMPGASQTIGLTEVFNRKADGQTLAATAIAGMVCQPLLGNTEYTAEDFRHIAFLTSFEQVALISSKNSGITSFDDLVAKLKNGDEVLFTSSNAGAIAHLAMLSICDQMDLPIPTYVSYSGSAEVMNAVLSGNVDIAINDVSVISKYYGTDELNILLTITEEVCEKMPEIPYASQYGLENMKSFTSPVWVVVKKETPDEIVEWVKQQINEATMSEAYQTYLETTGLLPYTEAASEDEVTAFVYATRDIYGELYEKYFNQ